MAVSVVVTTLNEEKKIEPLLDALFGQAKKPEEVIVVDGGSSDRTVAKIQQINSKNWKSKFKHRQNLKVYIRPGANIAQGRNYGIKKAKNEIIAVTDAGCVPHKDWLEKIVAPFKDPSVDVVAGFYQMITRNSFQEALAPYLGVVPGKFNPYSFLPSSRSIAFRKSIWEESGGYPEELEKTGEDTLFNLRLLAAGAKMVRVKGALVDWEIPNNPFRAFSRFYSYAKGDAQTRIWWHSSKKFFTHNLKILSVFIRYIVFITFPWALLLYILWAIFKHASLVRGVAVLWLPVIQFTSDIAVMAGFLSGMLKK